VFGDRLMRCGRCDLAEVSRVFSDRFRRCGRCVLAKVSRVFGDRVRGVSVADVWPRCPMCLVTDGRCALAKVSRAFGDRVRGVSVADVWLLHEVSRVLGDRWPMCLGRSVPCV